MTTTHDLGDGSLFLTGSVWQLHPGDKNRIMIHGRLVAIPRWQQAFGRDYHFSGQTYHALPVPVEVQPLVDWVRGSIDERLDGVLINWYDGPDQYIGPHRDSRRHMIVGAPIVTASFGETRTFRLSGTVDGEKRVVDFPATHGSLFVMPYATNLVWKHGVPKSTRYTGRRISVTFRAFE